MRFAELETENTQVRTEVLGSNARRTEQTPSGGAVSIYSLSQSSGLREDLTTILDRNGFRFVLTSMRAERGEHLLRFATADEAPRSGISRIVPRPEGRTYLFIKRLLDVVLASAGILLLLGVMLIIALAILIEDGAPVVYHQPRTGQGGRSFRFFKFRSMVRNAEKVRHQLEQQNEATGPIFKMRNDPRITSVGRFIRKTSLDELPQLVNVLRGEMSIVGPRPLYSPEAAKLAPRQFDRHNVQPGLLCFREVCGRSELTFDQWMELDLAYVRGRSIRTDLTIMLRAIPAILSSHGAY